MAALSIPMFCACQQEEDAIFDASAAERLEEAQKVFTDRIASSPNGWIFEYFVSPETDADNYVKGLGYLMMVNFKPDHSVVVGMRNYHTENEYWEAESLWEVITDMSAVLSFNSYNKCLHRFSEPENFKGSTSYGGVDTGKGMLGDYEFIIVDAPENGQHIYLKGKKHGAYSRLTRLGQDTTSFQNYLVDVARMQSQLLSNNAPNHLVMNIQDRQYNFIMPTKGGDLGLTKLWPAGTDSTFTMTLNPLLMSRRIEGNDTTYVVRFRDAIEGPVDLDITAQEFYYDPKTKSFYGEEEGISIVGEDPAFFFFEKWGLGARFQLTRSSDGTDKAKELINAVYQGYSDIRYTCQNIQLQASENGATLTIAYKTNKNANGKAVYNFSASQDGDHLKLQYAEPANSASQTQYNSIAAIANLCEALCGTYELTAGNNPLNLSTIGMKKTEDAGFVIVPTYLK